MLRAETKTDVEIDAHDPQTPDALPFQPLLTWLDRLLRWQIAVTRFMYGALADDEDRGLYVPNAEVALLLTHRAMLPAALVAERAELATERALLATAAPTAQLRLFTLAKRLGLNDFACNVLLLALAPESDLRYERVYAYIQDDVTRKRPTIDLALRLFCASPAAQLDGLAAFAADAPLLRHRLVQLYDDNARPNALRARSIKLDDRMVAELIGRPQLDAVLSPWLRYERPARTFESLVLPPGIVALLQRIADSPVAGTVLALQGAPGSGRQAIAAALCTAAGANLLTVDLRQLLGEQEGEATTRSHRPQPQEFCCRLLREAQLRNAAILWLGADELLHTTRQGDWRAELLAALDTHPGLSLLSLDQAWEERGLLRRARYVRVELPPLSYSARETLWRRQLGSASPDDATLTTLASTFRLSGGQIRAAATGARTLAHWRSAEEGSVSRDDLYAACRAQSSGKLDSLARKIVASYGWNDIVLPPDQINQLREICVQVRHRRTVLEQWGFDRQLAMGKGVNVLFAGQSGTGKTMAAEIIAADLGLELFKIDLSSLVSKYIGETEKNLDRIFTAAREANAILFFDEADSVFGKRSEVKDAHDRYANIEVGYLLQKMEEYDGIVILATNMRKNLDEAFVRRLHVAIDFPFPEEPDRQRIWRNVFPVVAPLGSDVDLAFIARQFKLAGGNIRNIALLSAYLAAEDGATIGMAHLMRAVRREYQKLGKLVTKGEFGPYLELVRE